jgi:Transglycosylase SLT domain
MDTRAPARSRFRLLVLCAAILGGAACDEGDYLVTDPATTCNGQPNPLLTHSQKDGYDCLFLDRAAQYQEPDAMIFKAQTDLESGFNPLAVSPDSPCGTTHLDWSEPETKSYGLMQVTPACGWADDALLSNGHPNLEQSSAAAAWSTSVFNPEVNVGDGVRAVSVMRQRMKEKFANCTEDEYTLMAIGAFNAGSNSAILACGQMQGQPLNYVGIVLSRYRTLAGFAGWPFRYDFFCGAAHC